jgi:bifunctional N-acetylglucosamine-1-phosphate-uridyltransferase/glucosamine-1-phosphate-acetyltransferase GlmU-like protein
MNELDKIFFKYRNKNIIMKWSDKDFSNLLNDLYDYFQSNDDVTEFMATLSDEYAQKYNIDFIEPEEFDMNLNSKGNTNAALEIPHRAPKDPFSEIKRMQELAGIFEEKEEKKSKTKEADLNVGLVFDTEELRDKALNTLKKQKLPLVYYSKDAVNIEFPLDKNSKYNKEKLTQVINKISDQFTKNKLHNSLTEFANEG